MGLRSGEYVGRDIRVHPAASTMASKAGDRWKDALSSTMTLPRGMDGSSIRAKQASTTSRLQYPSKTSGLTSRPPRDAEMMLVRPRLAPEASPQTASPLGARA